MFQTKFTEKTQTRIEIFQIKFIETIKTNIVLSINFFPENLVFYDIRMRRIVEAERPQMTV
jgi:hypothetical protein